MTPHGLERWLDTHESTGHREGREIVRILRTKKGELTDEDVHQMHRVVGYVHRDLAQGGPADDVEY